MARVRVSTLGDEEPLTDARKISGQSDAALIDDALRSYPLRHR